jgi:hypothetical protein
MLLVLQLLPLIQLLLLPSTDHPPLLSTEVLLLHKDIQLGLCPSLIEAKNSEKVKLHWYIPYYRLCTLYLYYTSR